MIDRNVLDEVRICISHADCPDGVASAILLADAFNDVPVALVKHGSPEWNGLSAKSGPVLFCDIAPPRERVSEFVANGSIVLDHHAKQKDIVEAFGSRGVYTDVPGESGAFLAFREVWRYGTTEGSDSALRAESFARLAGVRDTWMTESPDFEAACAQAEALKFYPFAAFADVGRPFGETGWSELQGLLSVGGILRARRRETVRREVEGAFGWKSSKGTRVMIVSTVETSDVAEAVGPEADVVVGFLYKADADGAKIILSMRSHTGFDVGAFCAAHGGGGHVAAAGVVLPVQIGDLNPYDFICRHLDTFEMAK